MTFFIVLFQKFPGGYEKTHVGIHIGDQQPDQDLNLGIPVYETCAAVGRLYGYISCLVTADMFRYCCKE